MRPDKTATSIFSFGSNKTRRTIIRFFIGLRFLPRQREVYLRSEQTTQYSTRYSRKAKVTTGDRRNVGGLEGKGGESSCLPTIRTKLTKLSIAEAWKCWRQQVAERRCIAPLATATFATFPTDYCRSSHPFQQPTNLQLTDVTFPVLTLFLGFDI